MDKYLWRSAVARIGLGIIADCNNVHLIQWTTDATDNIPGGPIKTGPLWIFPSIPAPSCWVLVLQLLQYCNITMDGTVLQFYLIMHYQVVSDLLGGATSNWKTNNLAYYIHAQRDILILTCANKKAQLTPRLARVSAATWRIRLKYSCDKLRMSNLGSHLAKALELRK